MIKKWLRYMVYIILILALAIFDSYIMRRALQDRTLDNYILTTITTVVNMLIGAILGFEQFIKEKNKKGVWKINLPKLILFGVPALFFILYPFLFYSEALHVIFRFLSSNRYFNIWTVIPLFRLLLGYCFITSFYKKNKENASDADSL